jgi:preprotein translocase subunit SecA
VEYVVQENQVIIVDENTGRLMVGRRWSDGLHQAVEAKEGVKVERETQTLATITIQNYFRMYDKLSGMTGTAETEADEFHQIYKLDVVVIPTNRPVRRMDYNDAIYKTQREKYAALVAEITECHQAGQPILVGTVSVEMSEVVSRMLRRANIPHNVLNAKNHQREADIVSRAGQPGAVTIATNMAGRGTDIKLGEGVVTLPLEVIRSQVTLDDKHDGRKLREILMEKPSGLYVIGTTRHESRRIDRQLRGRCARQGDPGASRFYISLEDDLMRLFGSDRMSKYLEKLGLEEGQVLEHPWLNKSVERAQRRVEEQYFAIRKRTLEYDDVMNAQREVIYGFRTQVLRSEHVRDELYSIIEDVIDERAQEVVGGDEALRVALLEWVNTTFPVGMRAEQIHAQAEDAEAMAAAVFAEVRKAYELKIQAEHPEHLEPMERGIILRCVDTHWQEYLRNMDALRQGVGLRAYGQRDPLVEYKKEAFEMFAALMGKIKEDIAGRVFRVSTSLEAMQSFFSSLPRTRLVHEEVDAIAQQRQARGEAPPAKPAPQGAEEALQAALSAKPPPVRRETAKVGRNDPCPCGSGKKYKKCHGAG